MFYSYFDYLCKQKGVSKNKACQEMGVSRNVAAKWKSTNTNPNMTTLSKISEYFGVSIDELLRHNEEEKPAPIRSASYHFGEVTEMVSALLFPKICLFARSSSYE